ncbi:MAG TPA: response regulator [Negativicutes bacterium]|nr:response regulator [Negativicutes bacterium]
MLRAVIVDDEQPAIDLLKILLEGTGKVQCVGEYGKPSEAAGAIPALKPDIVFLDVQMPGINGVELAEILIDQAVDTNIVFVTAYSEYAVQAFELNAIDYLLKPASPKSVERAVARIIKLKQSARLFLPGTVGTQIHGFGKLEVRKSSDGSLVKWRTAKVEELFAFLLYHRGTIVRKGDILENLWPECEPKIADSNLHTSVYQLKKTFKENGVDVAVKFIGGGYVLEPGPAVEYDVAAFEAFTAKGEGLDATNIGEFEKMTLTYRDDYLRYEEYLWCMAERTRLQKYFVDLAKQVAHFYIHTGSFGKAEQIMLRSVGYLPYDEDAYELLLKICSLQGDRPGMMKYYETIQTTLENELGIEPRPSLKRLYEQLVNDS